MAYDKPKVTIDLEEYNFLKEEKNRIVGDEYVNMAKIVLCALFNSNLNVEKAQKELKDVNILFAVTSDFTRTTGIHPDNILIAKIKD